MIKQDYKSFDEVKAIALFDFVCKNTNKVDLKEGYFEMPKDFLKYLSENKGGSCGIHSMVFKLLCNKAGLKARRIIIKNKDTNFSHKVTEIFYDNRWHMYDPDLKIRFDESLKELLKKPDLLKMKYKKTTHPSYVNLYLSDNEVYYLRDTRIGSYIQKFKKIFLK